MVWKLVGGAAVIFLLILVVCSYAVSSDMRAYRYKDRRP